MRAGMTLLTKPNDGPVTKFALVGVAAFNTLKTSTSMLRRRPPPNFRSLLAFRFRMFCGDRRCDQYGSTRSVVLPFCVIARPPSGSACRKM